MSSPDIGTQGKAQPSAVIVDDLFDFRILNTGTCRNTWTKDDYGSCQGRSRSSAPPVGGLSMVMSGRQASPLIECHFASRILIIHLTTREWNGWKLFQRPNDVVVGTARLADLVRGSENRLLNGEYTG